MRASTMLPQPCRGATATSMLSSCPSVARQRIEACGLWRRILPFEGGGQEVGVRWWSGAGHPPLSPLPSREGNHRGRRREGKCSRMGMVGAPREKRLQ